MKKLWFVIIVLLTSCAQPSSPTQTAQNGILTPRPVATLTPTQPPKIRTSAASPTAQIRSTQRPEPTETVADPQWKALAAELRCKTQLAINEKHWEDIQFKEDAYSICNQLIDTSTGKVRRDSREILKRFRWGIEFMDHGELQEVLRILDRYN
jgi:hypothetical protein